MAAIVVPSPRSRPVVPPAGRGRPHLVVLPGGSVAVLRQRIDAHRRELTFWRRRVVAAAIAILVVWGLAHAVGAGLVWLQATRTEASAPSLATTAPPGVPDPFGAPAPLPSVDLPATPSAGTVYVVKPGDTLWSIAANLRPESDTREVIAALKARTGGAVLQPGQRIDVVDLP